MKHMSLPFTVLFVSFSLSVALAQAPGNSPRDPEAPAEYEVERVGPPTFYAPPIDRYQMGAPDVNDSGYYPIPKSPVTRATYMAWLEQSGIGVTTALTVTVLAMTSSAALLAESNILLSLLIGIMLLSGALALTVCHGLDRAGEL